MSREKQIEEMTDDLIFTSHYGTQGAVANYLIGKGWSKQEWISVDERLPKHLEKVVAIDNWGDMFTAVYIMFVNGKSTWSTPYSHGGKVTHWMPLPEAPKMKGGAE